MAGNHVLMLNQYNVDANGDSISINRFNYYISNIVLNTSTGGKYSEYNSYHLVQLELPTSSTFNIAAVPAGIYTSMTFLIGVDSLHNISGAQTGALDPQQGMFWDWNTGYIMAKIEGLSPQSGATNHSLEFHIGGYSGPYTAIRKVTLVFPQPLMVANKGQATTFLHADAMAWFKGAHVINVKTSFATTSPSVLSSEFADNYANMFGIDSVKNTVQ